MAYREPSPDAEITVHAGTVASWRAFGAAVLGACGLGMGAHVGGAEGATLCVPAALLTLAFLARGVSGLRWVSVRVAGRSVRVHERGLAGRVEADVEVAPASTLCVERAPDPGLLGRLPGDAAFSRSAILVTTADGEQALTSMLYGTRWQRVAAERIARRLGLPPPAMRSAPRSPWTTSHTLMSFAVALTCVSALGLAFDRAAAACTGVIELVCTERCLFEGMECLPGGSISARFAPGEQVVAVEDGAAPNGMRDVRVPVWLHHRTVFECRSDARVPTPEPEP